MRSATLTGVGGFFVSQSQARTLMPTLTQPPPHLPANRPYPPPINTTTLHHHPANGLLDVGY